MSNHPARYVLEAFGHTLDASAHALSAEEVQRVADHEKAAAGPGLVASGLGALELEELLLDYDYWSVNRWVIDRPMPDDYTDFCVREVVDDTPGRELFQFTAAQAKRSARPGRRYSARPRPGGGMVYYESHNKGFLCSFWFTSDTVPTLEDFEFHIGAVVSPGKRIEVVDGVSFRGQSLEFDYDGQSINNQGFEVSVYRGPEPRPRRNRGGRA